MLPVNIVHHPSKDCNLLLPFQLLPLAKASLEERERKRKMEFSLARSFACSLSSQCRKLFTNAFVALPSADAVNFGAKFNIIEVRIF